MTRTQKPLTKISKQDFDNMVLLDNQILFRPSRDSFGVQKTESGLVIPQGWEQGKNFCTDGTILKIGNRTKWSVSRSDMYPWTYSAAEVSEGDKVWVNRDAMIFAYAWGAQQNVERIFDIEDTGVAIMLYYGDLRAVQKENIEPLNGFCLVNQLSTTIKSTLLLPDHLKERKADMFFRIERVNKNPVEYFNEYYPHDKDVHVKEGDTVLIDPVGDLPFDTDINSPYKHLRLLQRRNIQAIIHNYDNTISAYFGK